VLREWFEDRVELIVGVPNLQPAICSKGDRAANDRKRGRTRIGTDRSSDLGLPVALGHRVDRSRFLAKVASIYDWRLLERNLLPSRVLRRMDAADASGAEVDETQASVATHEVDRVKFERIWPGCKFAATAEKGVL